MSIQEQVLAVRADGQSTAEVDRGLLSVLTLLLPDPSSTIGFLRTPSTATGTVW